MKFMGVNLRVQFENIMRCDKPLANISVVQKYIYEVVQERRCISAGSTLGVSAGRIKPRGSNTRTAIDLVTSCGLR